METRRFNTTAKYKRNHKQLLTNKEDQQRH